MTVLGLLEQTVVGTSCPRLAASGESNDGAGKERKGTPVSTNVDECGLDRLGVVPAPMPKGASTHLCWVFFL